ncbi:MAG: hypothetical protein U0559_07425 [Anaerolineae bacterium]
MRTLTHMNWLKSLVVGFICVGALAACGGPRSQSNSAPTTAPQATAAPQKAQPTAIPAQPTVAPTAVPPTSAPAPTATTAPAPTTAPAEPSKSSQSGAALEQTLEQLFNANSSGDALDDVPQLK